MGVTLERLAVMVTADVDARGAALKSGAPVGVQSMVVAVLLRIAGGATTAFTENLVHGAESQSVLLQTLRVALPIRLVIDDESAAAMAA